MKHRYSFLPSLVCALSILLCQTAQSQTNFWQQTNGPYTGGSFVGSVFALAFNSSGHIFVGTWGGGVFRSADNGGSWTQINTGLMDTYVKCLAINSSGDIFAGTYGGVFRSMDNGGSWSRVGWRATMIFTLAINSSGDIFAGSYGGVFRSTDNGASWAQGGFPYDIHSLAINSSGDIFSGTYGAVYRSTDNGASWTRVYTGLENTYTNVTCLAINSSGDIFAGTYGAVFHSTDNGGSWTQLGFTNAWVGCLAINSSDHIFAGTYAGAFRSTDNGGSWTQINAGFTYTYTSVDALAINSNGYVFAGTDYGLVFRSVESTTVISVAIDVKPGSFPNAISPGSNGIIPVAILTTSTFDATTVDLLSVKFGPKGATEIHNRGHIEDVDGDGDLDLMLHFATQATGIKAGDVSATLTGRTYSGKRIRGSDEILTVGKSEKATSLGEEIPLDIESGVPTKFDLSSNYPNPFNPATTIQYQLPVARQVSLRVYNMLGELVATLVDQYQEQGYYHVQWKAQVPSGMYIYRLQARSINGARPNEAVGRGQAGDFIASKKLIVIK